MSDHEKCFAVCENKCFVETMSKEQIEDAIEDHPVNHAIRADYASSDTSKGTIEERLTALGFREGTLNLDTSILNSGASVALNEITRQGNYVIGNLRASNSGTSFTDVLYALGASESQQAAFITIPEEFRPRANTTIRMCVEYVSLNPSTFVAETSKVMKDISTTSDGHIPITDYTTLPPSSRTYYVKSIDIHFGYEAAPIQV